MQTAPPCHCITSIRFTIFRFVEMIKKSTATQERNESSAEKFLCWFFSSLRHVMRNFILYFVLVLYIWCVCVNLLHKHKEKCFVVDSWNTSAVSFTFRERRRRLFETLLNFHVYSATSNSEERSRWWLCVQIVEPERERSRCFNSKRFSTFRSCFPLFSVKFSCETTTTLLSVIDNRSKNMLNNPNNVEMWNQMRMKWNEKKMS